MLRRPAADGTPSTSPLRNRSTAGTLPPTPASSASTGSSPQPTSPAWRSYSLGGSADVAIPADWPTSRYRGVPATVYFPLIFVSNHLLTGPCTCATATPPSCTTTNWFPPDRKLAPDQVLILWAEAEFVRDGPAFVHIGGRRTTIDHRPGRISSGAATARCPPGAGTEGHAYVRRSAHAFPGERFDMTACLGPNVSAADRQAVYTMLSTLRIHS